MLVLIALTLTNCSKDSGSTSSITGSGLNLKIASASKVFNLPVNVGRPVLSTLPTITWDTALMVVSSINIVADMFPTNGQVGATHNYNWMGPRTIDLFNKDAFLGMISIPPGRYLDLKFTVYSYESDAKDGMVMYLSGWYKTSSGTSVPLIIEISNDIVLNGVKQNVTLTTGNVDPSAGIVQVYLERLFTSILPHDLDSLSVTPGAIIISATSNQTLYNLIIKAIGNTTGS